MGYTHETVGDEVNILSRLGGWEGIGITLDSTAFTDHVCKAGAPIGSDGTIQNDGDCVGILMADVYDTRPQGTILKKGYVKDALITSHYGTAIDATAKAKLPMIVFE